MKHLIICREFPPAPSGGIGTYVMHISKLLAARGETVHLIGQLWAGAEKRVEERCGGKLIIHRIPLEDWNCYPIRKPSPALDCREARELFESDFYPQAFSWQASLLAEKLITQEGIDIIEAQEYEAPLYYLQLRRALGRGPKRQPPCLIHLHSPTMFIALHNDWNLARPTLLTSIRLENYSIAAADALLCPSRYLAGQAESRFGLAPGTIRVIPLPIGENPCLERREEIWQDGTICYMGRLERRKGVLEWLQAIAAVAPDYPDAHFEFLGANVLGTDRSSGEQLLNRLIPDALKARIHFRGEQRRCDMPAFLAKARIAAVPSRWENFPNTCVEAMCSGLPVIASAQGGMSEMVRDGATGWLAGDARKTDLAAAVKRALETPPSRVAEMGRQAAIDIRQMCDNAKIVEAHLQLRSEVAGGGASRSVHLPASLPWANRPFADMPVRRVAEPGAREGIAVVITVPEAGEHLDTCLRSIDNQTRSAAAVVVVVDRLLQVTAAKNLQRIQAVGRSVCITVGDSPAAAKNRGVEEVFADGVNPVGFVFLDGFDRLRPGYLETCESVFRHCPEVGLVASWVRLEGSSDRFLAGPCAAFPYQLLGNDDKGVAAIRTEALNQAGPFRTEICPGYEDWDLATAVLAAGWVAVTFPALLSERVVLDGRGPKPVLPVNPCRVYQQVLSRIPTEVARDAAELAFLLKSRLDQLESSLELVRFVPTTASGKPILKPRDILHLSFPQQVQLARKAVFHPGQALSYLFWHLKDAGRRAGLRRFAKVR